MAGQTIFIECKMQGNVSCRPLPLLVYDVHILAVYVAGVTILHCRP